MKLKLSRDRVPGPDSVPQEPQARVAGGDFDADGCALGRDRATTLSSPGTEYAVPGDARTLSLPERRKTALRTGYAACLLPG